MAEVKPLDGVRVLEFSHMVMGPSCGLILADLGADVVKVEPLKGDNTRRLGSSGAGFFPTYNRNKRSFAVDMKSSGGVALVRQLAERADVLLENFRPGALDKLELDYDSLAALNPRLIYCSLKGFLKGPYEHRTALDEVVQMMGGLAYMTGLPDRPLRVGASVNDIMGGMFGAIAILAALREREHSGRGQRVNSALFENCAFLVGQHMVQYAVTGVAPRPMSIRMPAWGVYDIFETADHRKVFVGVVSDTQWKVFCESFQRPDLAADGSLATNNQRVAVRDTLLPRLQREIFGHWRADALMERLEAIGLPFAPITSPPELYDDPHLNASHGLVDLHLPDSGELTRVPALPMSFDGQRPGLRHDLARVGEHTRELLAELGYDNEKIAALVEQGSIAL